jgi:hypothetical protein
LTAPFISFADPTTRSLSIAQLFISPGADAARPARHATTADFIYNPLHYFALLEQKTKASNLRDSEGRLKS